MNFVFPSVTLIDEKDNFKRIERSAKICYQSTHNISENSAFPFFQRMCKNGHTSTLEHSVIFVRTHTPEACMKLKQILTEYIEETGYPHYIRYSRWGSDENVYNPDDIEYDSTICLGVCLGSEHLFSGNIRAWRKLCERFSGEGILYDTFSGHPAFEDIFQARDMKLFGKILPKEPPFWTKEHIEIVDSIPTDPEEFRDAYKHNIVTLDIVGDRGVIDEWCRHRVQGISVESTRYCVAGSMKLTTSNPGNHPTIQELYDNIINSSNGAWKRVNIRQYNENTGELQYTKIKNIFYNGNKDCIKLTTRLGYEIICTHDHKILTDNGYVEAYDVAIGSKIYVNGTEELYKNKDWLYHQNIDLNKTFVQISKEFGYNISTLKKWARQHGLPKKGTGYFNIGHTPWNKGIQDPRQIEALRKYHHSGIYDDRKIIKPDTCKYMKHNTGVCEICKNTEDLEVHHVDKNRTNHNPDNLITLCKSCHQRVHSNNLLVAYLDEVVSVEYAGVQPVYDIEVDSEFHNFVANGIVVHNCNYSNNGVTFVFPYWYEKLKEDPKIASLAGDFGNRCYDTEVAYQEWIKKCGIPQMARGNLTLWVKSEGAFTATIQQWIDILKLRDSPAAHPEAQRIAKMIEEVLVNQVGVKDIWGVNN